MMNASAVQRAHSVSASDTPPAFEFRGGGKWICAGADTCALPRGGRDDLAARLKAAFDSADPRAVVAGAMPFRHADTDALWLARQTETIPARPRPVPSTTGWTLREEPSGAAYADAVSHALRLIAGERDLRGGLRKVVLARSLVAQAPHAIDLRGVFDRLATDPAAMAYLLRLPAQDGPRHLIGATPELLLRKTGARIFSHPLAGSARRSADPEADRAAGAALERSAKDRHEHRFVVEFIMDTLSPLCRDLSCPEDTVLTSTQSMWHLGTRIEGTLKDAEVSAAVLAAALHPTPAVCGAPQDRAARAIAELEPVARGFYAGAVGWCDAAGDGAWFVAIRCAEVSGDTARLYAGAGVVAGSDPEAERAETAAKFTALLIGLGLDHGKGDIA